MSFLVVAILKGSGWGSVGTRSLLEETFGLLEETPGLRKADRLKLRHSRAEALAAGVARDADDREMELEP
ncbi:MAG TPA: hypothetical protein VNG93_04925 [Candidatus Dormibacteraeota bacterium]|nr:hypothetical protein [Candidatus Dormibacteraeota bacterium]